MNIFGLTEVDFLILSVPFLLAFIYWYNHNLKSIGVKAFFFWKNYSTDLIPAKEIIAENRIELKIGKGKEAKPLSFNISGLPTEWREGPTRRSRLYLVKEGHPDTFQITDAISDVGDPIAQTVLELISMVKMAESAMTAKLEGGFMKNLPYFLMGAFMSIAIWLIMTKVFPSLG